MEKLQMIHSRTEFLPLDWAIHLKAVFAAKVSSLNSLGTDDGNGNENVTWK